MKNVLLVLNYNSASKVKSLVKTTEKFEHVDNIVIVDNSSSDTEFEKLKTIVSVKVHIIKSETNRGYAAGNNLGLDFISRHFQDDDNVFILNPDISITDENIVTVSTYLDYHSNAGMVTIPMRGGHSAWRFTSFFKNIFIETGAFAILFKKFNAHYKYYYENSDAGYLNVDVVAGSFFGIKLKNIKKVKYFDFGTFLYYEEEILSKKLKKIGLNGVVVLQGSYTHLHDYKSEDKLVQKTKILNSSRRYFFNKYFNLNIIQRIFLRVSDFENISLAFIKTVLRKKIGI